MVAESNIDRSGASSDGASSTGGDHSNVTASVLTAGVAAIGELTPGGSTPGEVHAEGVARNGTKKARRWSKFVVRFTIFSLLYLLSPVPVGIWCHLATAVTPKAVDNVVWVTFRTVYAPIQFAYSRNNQVKRFYDNYQGFAEQALLMAISGDDDAA